MRPRYGIMTSDHDAQLSAGVMNKDEFSESPTATFPTQTDTLNVHFIVSLVLFVYHRVRK